MSSNRHRDHETKKGKGVWAGDEKLCINEQERELLTFLRVVRQAKHALWHKGEEYAKLLKGIKKMLNLYRCSIHFLIFTGCFRLRKYLPAREYPVLIEGTLSIPPKKVHKDYWLFLDRVWMTTVSSPEVRKQRVCLLLLSGHCFTPGRQILTPGILTSRWPGSGPIVLWRREGVEGSSSHRLRVSGSLPPEYGTGSHPLPTHYEKIIHITSRPQRPQASEPFMLPVNYVDLKTFLNMWNGAIY